MQQTSVPSLAHAGRPDPRAARGGVWFLVIFAGVFLCAGLGVLAFGLPRALESGDREAVIASSVVGTLFALIGGGGVWLALHGRHSLEREAELRRRHPESPWLWSSKWADAEIRGTVSVTAWVLLAFALFWNGVSWPILPDLIEQYQRGKTEALVGLLFPLVGIGLAVAAGRALVRLRKFGTATLRLETLPGVIGGHLGGMVQLSARVEPEAGFVATLSCIRRVTSGSGKNRSTREEVLFQEKLEVPRVEVQPGPRGSNVPVRFRIPYDCKPTDEENASDATLWRVELTAEVPGVDFATHFEVPVFRTAESSPEITTSADPLPDLALSTTGGNTLAGSKVRALALPEGGVELFFGMARNPKAASALTAFWIIWTGFTAGLFHLDAPVFFRGVFGLFALLIGVCMIQLWLGTTRVRATPRELRVKSALLLGIGPSRRFPSNQIESVEACIGMQSGSKVYYYLSAKRRSASAVTCGNGIPDKREAEGLAAALSSALRGSADSARA